MSAQYTRQSIGKLVPIDETEHQEIALVKKTSKATTREPVLTRKTTQLNCFRFVPHFRVLFTPVNSELWTSA